MHIIFKLYKNLSYSRIFMSNQNVFFYKNQNSSASVISITVVTGSLVIEFDFVCDIIACRYKIL